MANQKIYLAPKSDLSNYLSLDGGSIKGALNIGGNPINNLASPSNDNDATTKSYVDNAINLNSNVEITPLKDINSTLVMISTTYNENYKRIDLFTKTSLSFEVPKIDNNTFYLSTYYNVSDFKSHFNSSTDYYPWTTDYPVQFHAHNTKSGTTITSIYQHYYGSRLYNDNLWFSILIHNIYGTFNYNTNDTWNIEIDKGTILYSCIAIKR